MQIGLWRPVQRRRRHILVLRLDPVCLEADLIWSKMYPGLIKYPPNSTIGNIQLGFHKSCHQFKWLLLLNLLQLESRNFLQENLCKIVNWLNLQILLSSFICQFFPGVLGGRENMVVQRNKMCRKA